MKRKIICFMALLLSVVPLSAQFRNGVKGGGNLSNINMNWGGVDLENFDPRMGVHAGLMGEYMFSSHLGLQAELVYSRNGATINPAKHRRWFEYSEDVSVEGFESMHMFCLPIYLKAKFPLTHGLKMYVMGGGFASFSLSGYHHQRLTSGQESLKLKWSLYDPQVRVLDETGDNLFLQQRWNVGLSAEAGVEIRDKVIVGVGFSPVLNNMAGLSYLPGSSSVKPNVQMWTVNASVGYFF